MSIRGVNEIIKTDNVRNDGTVVSKPEVILVPLSGAVKGVDGTQVETTAKTDYVVQPGDTPKVIAKKLGMTGAAEKSLPKTFKRML